MIRWSSPPIPQDKADRMEALVKAGVAQPQVIWEMRAAGLNIVECIKLISQFYAVSLTDAKIAVHYSDAWASMRGEYDAFHEMVFEAAKQDGWEEVDQPVPLRSAS